MKFGLPIAGVLGVLVLLASLVGQEPTAAAQEEEPWVTGTREFNERDLVPPQELEAMWKVFPISSIRLARSRPEGEIEGFYPEYDIRIDCASEESATSLGSFELGPVTYTGKSDVQMIGEYHSALTIADFSRLALLMHDFEVLEGMKDYPKRLEESPHTLLEITMKSGKVHRMSEWGSKAPVGVWAFTCVIDKIWADRLNESR